MSSPNQSNNRQSYLLSLGIPPGLISTFTNNLTSCDLRLFLIDNSSSMLLRDAHRIGGGWGAIQKLDGATRWEEMQDCVAFCADMAVRCWIPTKFCLVNDPKSPTTPQKFSLCCHNPSTVPSEMQQIKQIMTHTNPASFTPNPLTYHIRNITSFVSREASRLHAQQKHVTLIICTQGLPTDQSGHISREITHEFQEALVSLSSLPVVKIVFRLATDDERVVEFYNSLDSKSAAIDVLDDYWGEALEVYMHNPWLTYGLGLHRLREAGCAWGIFDTMDERPLTVDQLYVFCTCFLLGGGPSTTQLPHPRMNWDAFLHGLNVLLQKEKLQWNPVLGKPTPWMDLNKLNAIYGGHHNLQQHMHHHAPDPQFATQQQYGQDSSSRAAGTHATQNHQHHAPKPSHPSTHPSSASAKSHTHHKPSAPQQQTRDEHVNKPIKDQIMLTWALIPPQYQKLHPLPRLLVTVPNTFTRVEPHPYFDKWKPFSKEAFEAGGSEQKALMKRAVRKTKFFLHPDKLPNDLTVNQAILFKSLWEVINDSWEALERDNSCD